MDWLRDWIMQIAGIIVIGAVCDTVMTDGNMKKYIKMVVGLVLVFAVIRPIVNFSPESVNIEIPQTAQVRAVEFKNRLDIKEREEIFKIYRKKLARSVENYVYSQWGTEAKAEIEVEEENESSFGNIKSIRLEIYSDSELPKEEIKKYIGVKFDVSPHNIEIELNGK